MSSVLPKSTSIWSLILNKKLKDLSKIATNIRKFSSFSHLSLRFQHFEMQKILLDSKTLGIDRHFSSSSSVVQQLLAEVEREKQREREAKKKAGEEVNDDEEEDYMGIGPFIEKLEQKIEREKDRRIPLREEDELELSDSESDDDERFTPEALKRGVAEFDKKFKRHKELLKNFTESETLDDAFKWMGRIDRFEQKYLQLPLEYRVIGELMNRLKEATGKERFMLLQKLNRATRLMEWKEAYDPNNPSNYGVIQHRQAGLTGDLKYSGGFEKEKMMLGLGDGSDEEEEYDEMKEKDDALIEKLNAIDKKLDEKLTELDRTFGKKGRVLEQEIRDLAEERYSLTAKTKRPLYRKGFDVRAISVNRTCKVTKGGQIRRFTALLVCGNYHGVIGFAKGKGPTPQIAMQKAYEKCFQNLHYVDRYEDHTIAHAIQTKYEKTKVYLWPASTRTGVVAGKTVETVLYLAGFKNVKSKVIGSRNPHNTLKALFKALTSIETPKDMQEKLGRTVVESYLL